jgi:hypothetical protein
MSMDLAALLSPQNRRLFKFKNLANPEQQLLIESFKGREGLSWVCRFELLAGGEKFRRRTQVANDMGGLRRADSVLSVLRPLTSHLGCVATLVKSWRLDTRVSSRYSCSPLLVPSWIEVRGTHG